VNITFLPTLNASLNATCAALLILGYVLIRRKIVKGHTVCMLAATCVSVLFLISYLYYHFHHGATPFQGRGWIRIAYFTVLISHTVLAVCVVPLVLVTLTHAFRQRFAKHKRIARITFPVWLYVSVTGVAVYLLLYHYQPS
jgi:uncharacterized membrane protein YozB (DUF420 family)